MTHIDKVRVERPERVGEPERWFVERWTPHELSFVAVGADPGAQVRAADEAPTFPFELVTSHTRTMETAAMDEPAQTREAAPEAAFSHSANERANTAPSDPAPAAPNADQVRAEERDRVAAIFGLADSFRHRCALRRSQYRRRALWKAGGIGADVAVRIIRKSPDRVTEFGDSRAVLSTVGIEIRRSQAATIAEDDLILIGAETYRIIGEPMGDGLGLVSACEAVKV